MSHVRPIDRFLTPIVLLNLARSMPGLQRPRVSQFVSVLQPFVTSGARRLLRQHETNLEMIANRFSTAKFDLQSLLDDVREIVAAVRGSLTFPRELNTLLMDYYIALFQQRAANKILANPARFTFSNAMIWNGFVTALESDLKLSVPLLRDVVIAVNMAPNIAERPEIAKEVCPSLTITTITFVLLMFVPDDVFPRPLAPFNFMDAYAVTALPTEISLPEPIIPISDQLRGLRLERWNMAAPTPKELKKFPYLKKYLQ
jgi:hypothetical protein